MLADSLFIAEAKMDSPNYYVKKYVGWSESAEHSLCYYNNGREPTVYHLSFLASHCPCSSNSSYIIHYWPNSLLHSIEVLFTEIPYQ